MLSLLRWGLGSGHEHLSEKERLAAVEPPHPVPSPPMEPARPVKRKRADGGAPPKPKRPANGTMRPVGAVEARPTDALRVVNSTGAAALLAQQAERDASAATPPRVPAPPATAAPAPAHPSPLDAANLGVVDLTATTAPVLATDKLQQTIATEFGLEILLKHQELRLIDQELAKCQVALEQLRRCQTIPYPSQSARGADRLNVSGGIGRPVRTAYARQPMHPAPWGVAEGPYSRHYAQWLLPDPAFDGGVLDAYPFPRTGKVLPDRHTRGSKGEQFLLATSKRIRGGLPSGGRLHALPAGYPEPKEHKGPMILKRAADDKLVKLVCLDCKREDFNSAQGFINHCRIAHSRGFASHEAAAQACGHEVEPSDVAPAPALHTPADVGAGLFPAAGALVHPLIKASAAVPTLSIPIPRAQRPATAPKIAPRVPLTRPLVDPAPATAALAPSAATPHLSKLFALAGRGGDLHSWVADATTHAEDPDVSSDEDDASDASDFDTGATSDTSTAPPMARMPSRGGLRGGPVKSTAMAPAESQKGVHGRPVRRAAAPVPLELPDRHHDLSPHTVASNNAPSLVSDTDDDDYADGRTASSPSTHASDEEDDADVEVDVDVAVDDGPRLRGAGEHHHHHHLAPPRVEVLPTKRADPELQTAAAGVATRRGPRGGIAKRAAPKKRGRPRKA